MRSRTPASPGCDGPAGSLGRQGTYDPATQTTNELDDVIEQCLRSVVNHLEMRDYEDKCARKGYDETDSSEEEVVLFGQADATDQASLDATDEASLDATDKADATDEAQDATLEEAEESEKTPINTSSFWGGRVNKQQTSLDSFVRRRPKR